MSLPEPAPKRAPVDWRERWRQVLPLISAGSSLRAACRSLGLHAPEMLEHVHNLPDVAERYARAQQARAATEADALIELADSGDVPADLLRIRVDTRKWVASKLLPRVYGDRLQVDLEAKGGFEIVVKEEGRQILDVPEVRDDP